MPKRPVPWDSLPVRSVILKVDEIVDCCVACVGRVSRLPGSLSYTAAQGVPDDVRSCSADAYVMMSTGHLNYTAKYADINDNRVRMRQIAWYCLYFQVQIFIFSANVIKCN